MSVNAKKSEKNRVNVFLDVNKMLIKFRGGGGGGDIFVKQNVIKPQRNKASLTIFSAGVGFLTLLGVMLAEGAAHAQTAATWKTVSGNWGTAANWDIGQVPNSNLFNATINSGSSTLDNNYTIQNFSLNGGELTGANTLTVNGIFNWGSDVENSSDIGKNTTINANGGLNINSSFDTLVLREGSTINNAGAANWTGRGVFQGNSTATFNNQAGATFTVQSGAHLLLGDNFVFNNAGTFVNNSGSGNTTNIENTIFNNTGTVNAQSGDLILAGGGAIGGTFTGAGNVNFYGSNGGTFAFQGENFTGTGAVNIGTANATIITGTLAGTAPINFTGGTLYSKSASVSGDSLNLTGASVPANYPNYIDGTLDISANSVLNISNANFTLSSQSNSTINNAGTTNWTASAFTLGSNIGTGTFNNQAGGTFTALSGSHTLNANGGVFNNAGTFVNNSGAGNTTKIAAQFNNTGNVRSTTGNLQFTGGYTQTAGSTVLNGGTLQSSNPLAINGGSLSGTGTITSAVNIGNAQGAGATIKAGSSPGQLNIIGNLNLASNATSAFDIAGITQGTEYSFLNVTGSANLNGGLLVNLLNGFTPTSSSIFTILTASNGISGTFNTNQISTAQGTFDVAYTANSVELEKFQSTPVPEPSSTLGILSLGAVGAGSFLKRKLKGRKQAI